eukprot:CAMPEP_0171309752 /NCGR_PEP_ID=MMETSP0816-20121228/19949_1 /TAXON_ID=420281 /ORGANISM="Proboscia inermis, Strain CCAP1064/1" /LENGTH=89 /DNA_ID=CAMNT_0011793507 /DNA_START=106 /DNA_END=372 /DNA_ORIENTATION=+
MEELFSSSAGISTPSLQNHTIPIQYLHWEKSHEMEECCKLGGGPQDVLEARSVRRMIDSGGCILAPVWDLHASELLMGPMNDWTGKIMG